MEFGGETLSKTKFAEPGRWIEVDALRQIHFGLFQATDNRDAAICSQLGIAIPSTVDVIFLLHFSEGQASRVANAIDSLDLAWRLASTISEFDELDLPEGGRSVNLEELFPPSAQGLFVAGAARGSLKVWFKTNRDSFERAIATLSAITAIAGVTAHDVMSAHTRQAGEPACEVTVVGDLDEQTRQTLSEYLPGLPGDCRVKATLLLPDGDRIFVEVPSRSLYEH